MNAAENLSEFVTTRVGREDIRTVVEPIMTSGCYIDELEGQRRELEARRAMLEERFKLRLATAQEFGVIHIHRLGRVREAFVAQCGAAQRRNQSIIDRVQHKKDVFSEERTCSGTSRNRLSHQMERFLSVADKLYPAWQEQQLQRKATQLGAIEEERFVTEQRRRVARQRFEQEQALAAVVSERRRRLAAARAHERNELALRRNQRDRSAAEDREALKALLERVNEAGRAARHDVLAEVSSNQHGHRDGNSSGSSSSSSSSERWGRGRRYIPSDDEGEEGEEFGLLGGPKGRNNRAGANRSANVSSPRSALQDDEEETHSQERSGLVRGGGGRSGSNVDEQLGLLNVFCTTRRGSPKVVQGRRGRRKEEPEQRDEDTRIGRHVRRAEGADESTSRSPSLAARNISSRSKPSTTATVEVELSAKETRKNPKKPRDDKRHRIRHRQRNQSDEGDQESPSSIPQPPRLADAYGDSSGENWADKGQRAAVESAASHSKNKSREESEPPPPPPLKVGSFPPPGSSRIRSFSSSDGSGNTLSPAGEVVSSGTLGTREGRVDPLQKGGESAEAPTDLGVGGRGPAAAKTPSWSDEDDNGGTVVDTDKPIRKNVPATLFSLAADLDEGGHADGGGGGGGGGGHKDEDSASSSGLPAATPPDQRYGTPLSLSATARAVAALTAKIERLAQESAPAAGRNSPASLLVLEAYRSVTAERHDAAAWGTATSAVVAAVSTIPADDTPSSSPAELEAFGMVALCGAVLDLIAANVTELLPPEALSGIVTAAKVRAQHRRGGKAGRVQLFDAVTSHARRLCSAAEAASERKSGGGVADPAAIAAVFVPCFEAVITAEEDARSAERLRRKVLALLESAADPNGASTKTRQTPPAEVVALPAIVAIAATGLGAGGGGGGGEDVAVIEKPAGNATIASDHAGSKEQRQQQHSRWGPSTSAGGASSGGVVLGGGRSVGSRKKKGGRLDLSSFGGSMSVFDTAGRRGSLPEFEDYESLEG